MESRLHSVGAVVACRTRVIDELRRRTAHQHAALDASLSTGTAGDMAPRDRYAGFLRASLAAVSGIEAALLTWLPQSCSPSRVAALEVDLRGLGEPAHHRAFWAPTLGSLDDAYGVAYVVEGSTLGGLVMADRFEAQGIDQTSYLRLRGKQTGPHWRRFLDALERDVTDRDRACTAAVATFEAYGAAFAAHGMA